MTRKRLPVAPEARQRPRVQAYISEKALARWDSGIKAAEEKDRTISIYDVIGQDFWTGEGVTAKRIAAALRAIGKGPVTVNINSPGGDLFEGFAIYNLLRDHDGEVTVKVLGLAASAASVIAMAGDTIQVSRASFVMIHNTWVMAIGNRNDLHETAEFLEPFDRAMADIYSSRTGLDTDDVTAMMDAETWMGGAEAIGKGFADEFLPSDQVVDGEKASAVAIRRLESALRASGMSADAAKKLISEFKASQRDAAGSGERDATDRGVKDPAALSEAAAVAASITNRLRKE